MLQVAGEDEDVRPDADLAVGLQLLVVDGQEVLVGREQGVEGALWRCNLDSFDGIVACDKPQLCKNMIRKRRLGGMNHSSMLTPSGCREKFTQPSICRFSYVAGISSAVHLLTAGQEVLITKHKPNWK